MITIPKAIIDEMISHSKAELPNESCGYLAGVDREIKSIYKMTNIDQSHEHFSFDPKEQFTAMKDARERGERLLVCYHSHPETPARLSVEDLRLLKDPNTIYVIVSLPTEEADIKAFNMEDGQSIPVEIKVS